MAPQLVGGRRAAGARVQEARARRRAVPGRAGPAGAREPVERRELGGAGRPRQDQLVPPRRSISPAAGRVQPRTPRPLMATQVVCSCHSDGIVCCWSVA